MPGMCGNVSVIFIFIFFTETFNVIKTHMVSAFLMLLSGIFHKTITNRLRIAPACIFQKSAKQQNVWNLIQCPGVTRTCDCSWLIPLQWRLKTVATVHLLHHQLLMHASNQGSCWEFWGAPWDKIWHLALDVIIRIPSSLKPRDHHYYSSTCCGP